MSAEGERMAGQRPVMWHHGQFLQPQHMQLQDRRLEALFLPYQQFVQPYFWGVARLVFREDSLARDVIAVKEARLLFPDGIFASVPENASLPGRSFEKAWVEREKPFQIYVGIRVWQEEDNVLEEEARNEDEEGRDGRYTVSPDPEDVADAYGDGPSATAFRLKYRLRFFWESEIAAAGDYALIPVARLSVGALGAVRLAPDYIPPLISTAGSEELVELLRGTSYYLIERSRQLEEFKAPSSLEMKHWDVKSVLFMLALRSINRALPPLRHALAAPDLHPWHIYGMLTQLLGDLSTFSDRVTAVEPSGDGSAAGIPLYSHTEIYACFKSARELLIQLLSGLVFEPDSIVAFSSQGPFQVADLLPHHFETGNGYWLILYTNDDIDPVQLAKTGSLKAGEMNALGSMLAKALPGIPLRHQTEPPPGIPRRSGAYYMSLDASSERWGEVPLTSKLAVYVANPPADLRLELAVFRIQSRG